MKRSIAKTIVRFFTVTLVLTILASGALGYYSAYQNELTQNRDLGRSAANITSEILDVIGLDRIVQPENRILYETVRDELRTVCMSLSLAYLYIYTVDEDEVRHYVMTVASDDELDETVREGLGLGAISREPLREPERAALKGRISDERFLLDNSFGKTSVWITPYTSPSGGLTALIGADVYVDVSNEAISRQFLWRFVPVSVFLIAAFLVLFILLRRRMVRPLGVVAKRMEAFDPSTESEPLSIRSQDEIQQIADAFEKMSSEIRTYIDNLAAITKKQEYERAQLDVARRIQYGMVPASFRDCRDGVDVCGLMQPAKEVGGDFYDCFLRPDGQYCALIADVSGKGVAGALFMALTKNLVRERIMHFDDPAAALNSVNDDLCAQNPEGMFVTLFALLLDPKAGAVRFANAGHNPPVLWKSGTAAFLDPKPGIALGLFPDAGIETERMTLAPGDGVLMYTDGVTEAVGAERTFYGTDRLLMLLQKTGCADSSAAVNAVKASVDDFSGDCEQFDDITAVAVRFTGASEWTAIPLTLDALASVKRDILSRCAKSADAKRIVLACEEAFVNIVQYAGATEADYRIALSGDALTVVFRDNGACFDPFCAPTKADDAFLSMDEGGLGIRFIRNIASDAHWSYTDGRNILTLVFAL